MSVSYWSGVATAGLVIALLCSAAQAQGTAGGGNCVFHPANGGDPVPVANGDTYTTRPAKGGKHAEFIPKRWKCEDGKLVRVE